MWFCVNGVSCNALSVLCVLSLMINKMCVVSLCNVFDAVSVDYLAFFLCFILIMFGVALDIVWCVLSLGN